MKQTISGSDDLRRNVDVGHMLELREKLAVSTAERDEARATAKFWQEQYGHTNPEYVWQELPWENLELENL